MSRKQKVSGFTLLELLVSMALTTMVLLLGQYIFSAFKRFALTYDASIDYTYELSILQQRIDRDLVGAKEWRWQEKQQSFCIEYLNTSGPCYEISGSSITRTWQGQKVSWKFQGELLHSDSMRQAVLRDTVHQLYMRFSLPKEGRARP
ncbi:MAG: prepilin-type N-terminal cleavage/methylation domain-containing protein [Bacteroidota bacterium]